MTPTPTPIIECPDLAGGGTPNVAAADVTCPQNPPGAISTQTSLVTHMVAHLESLAPDPTVDPPALEFKEWSGRPNLAALNQLRLEARCPGFVADQAAEVLARLWEGETLLRICKSPGMPRRSVVKWWAELVPEFGVMLAKAVEAAGEVLRDEAADMALDQNGDPAMVRAILATAGAYDRRIAKGEGDVQVAQGITVTIQKFSTDS